MSLTNPIRSEIADEVFRTRGVLTEVVPFSQRYPDFELADSYWVVEEMRRRREANGEKIIGRKIGFTNSAAWAGYGITGPLWNYLYDTTTFQLSETSTLEVRNWPNVRMEAEVALGLKAAPNTQMNEEELLDCVEWVALDFEVCTSIFPDWQFKVADGAATGVHVALLLGERHLIAGDHGKWAAQLESFTATLSSDEGFYATGGGAQVLGGPIKAFRYLVRELERFGGQPLASGDIVTTGTLTVALPAQSGQRWKATTSGIAFEEISLDLV
ncbi:2-keto-4-pentenoate hydratase [Agrobacterium pusense]|uniref:Hydratase/decarboxylase n=1 Tax=Agrobacterium pusense TaxID=648995 RepID=U4Q4A2_9HYPH|nr:Hydratase/decarboxylase [Agrobacterium pusense]CDI12083.1 Hydratase/decarboxylase [Agrobacterium pusense]